MKKLRSERNGEIFQRFTKNRKLTKRKRKWYGRWGSYELDDQKTMEKEESQNN